METESGPETYENEVLRHVRQYLPRLPIRNPALGVVSFTSVSLTDGEQQTQVVIRFLAAARPGQEYGLKLPARDRELFGRGVRGKPSSWASVVLAHVQERVDKYRPTTSSSAEVIWLE